MKTRGTPLSNVLTVAFVAFALVPIGAAQQDDASTPPKQDIITTVVGGGPNEIPALKANIYNPWQIAVDKQGNYYFGAGGASSRVFKINPEGILSVVAGNGIPGYSGDGILAVDAEVAEPKGVAVDEANPANVYINDGNCLIRRVDGKTGIITTIAGIITKTKPFRPTCQSTGDGGEAKNAGVVAGWDIVLDPRNNDLYFTEDGQLGGTNTGKVRKIAGGTATGKISTVAGNESDCGGSAPQGVIATAPDAFLCHPQSLALDTTVKPANIFIDGWGDRVVREVVGATGRMYTLVGGFVDPWQLSVQVKGKTTTVTVPDYNADDAGRIYQFHVTYSGEVPAAGPLKPIAGSGAPGFCGDGGRAIDACMDPVGLALDNAGNWIVGDQGQFRIRKINGKTGIINSIEGWGPTPASTQLVYSDPVGIKNVPGTGVTLNLPTGVYVEPKTNKLLIGADQTEAVYLLNTANGEVSNFAGNGIEGFAGDGDAATNAKVEVNNPDGVVSDSKGNVYSPDANNHAIRKVIAATGEITTVVGGSEGHLNGAGYSGNGGPAKDAQINNPHFLAVDAEDNLYITEYFNCVVRKVDAKTQIISTYAGIGGACGYNGSNRPANTATLSAPQGVAFDGKGNLYVAEGDDVIRAVNPTTGLITIVAGGVGNGYNGDGPATTRRLNSPQGVAADANGNIFFADDNNNILRWVDPGGQMVTFAGSPPGSKGGSYGFAGDGGLATQALLGAPRGITQDGEGNFYFTDRNNGRVRKVTAFAGYGRSTGSINFFDVKAGAASAAQTITLSAIGPVTIGTIRVPAGFKAVNHCHGVKLTRGETCSIAVSFTPGRIGSFSGNLTINSDAYFKTQGNTIALSGMGTSLPQAATPAIKPGTGTYTKAQTVTIKDSTPGAVIHYTTNGLTPTAASPVYSGPIPVTRSTLVQAIAVADGYENSEIGLAGLFIE